MTLPPKQQWGISTLGCPELDLLQVSQLMHRHDIQTMEIRMLANRLDLASYFDETYEDQRPIQDLLTVNQQRIVALNSGFDLMEADADSREELMGFVRWAEALNIPYIRIFGGGTMDEPLTETDLDKATASLDWWYELRLEKGWQTQLALELHSGFSSGERCLQLQERIDHPLDIIWDTHHSWKLGNETLSETWGLIGHLVRHVHIKDSVSVPFERYPHTYVLPGKGEFPAQEALQILSQNNYQGVVSLEWERKWHPYLPPLSEALEAMVVHGWR